MADDFEPGDEGFAEMAGAATVWCPYCGEAVELIVDPGGGALQEYVEDCEVCCRPWSLRVRFGADGVPFVEVGTLDDA